MRLAAQSKYSGERSQAIHLRFSCSAQAGVVPEPQNGSIIVSPKFDDAKINFLKSSSGFCVG